MNGIVDKFVLASQHYFTFYSLVSTVLLFFCEKIKKGDLFELNDGTEMGRKIPGKCNN